MNNVSVKIFALGALVVLFLALPLWAQSESMWAPAVVVGDGARTEIKLLNALDRPRHLTLSFYQELDSAGDRSPYLPVVLGKSGGGLRNTHGVVLGSQEQKTLTVFRPDWNRVLGWMEVNVDRFASVDFAGRPTEPPGPIQGLSGAVTIVADGESYGSKLTRDLNEFRFPVNEIHDLNEKVRWATIVAVANTNPSLPPTIFPLGVVYNLVDAKGKTIAETTRLQPSQTQDALYLWQIFVDTPEEWFALIGGDRFAGELQVLSGYAPVAAISIASPY